MELPIEGTITSGYGNRIDPISGEKKFHKGVDIGAPLGTKLLANLSGIINFAGYKSGYGNVVILESGGIEQTFAHLNTIGVKKGQTVSKGDLLGEVGSTGYSTGPHLHWELSYRGANQDPTKFNVSLWDNLQAGWESLFNIPDGENDILGGLEGVKSTVNSYLVKGVLIMLLIVFIILAFYPGSKTKLVKGVVEK